ncbi:family 43 glycosylhydrolase, partial [Balneolaceae bacterium ANBcel3]|nr:family 43 glycosylhydrolase [Balneolaceae bacterium ANBcel3]
AQPVPFDWSQFGNEPGGGVWGGHTVYYNDWYWHFYGRGGGRMYVVKAEQPEGPWSRPEVLDIPQGMHDLGVDNSIFIDEESGRWFLLTKAGHSNNHMVELGDDGQPTGEVLNLSWLNPSPDYPYGWAEGPVMWYYNGYYYYSFAEHLVGEQYVMRSEVLSDDPDDWEIMEGNMYRGARSVFDRPNHISPAVTLEDGTSWAIGHSYRQGDWYAQGRQGLLHQLEYNEDGWPLIQFPKNEAEPAPDLPHGGVPWLVPGSDMFDQPDLDPEWSVLGYTPLWSISLTERPGWLYLEPFEGGNTVIKNDGEHGYTLITKVDFDPVLPSHEAGLWIFNGPETHKAKLFSSRNQEGRRVVAFEYQNIEYEEVNTAGEIVWLKLVRDDHILRGYFSSDGMNWIRVGEDINIVEMDRAHPDVDFNAFTGNQQGLFVQGRFAFFNHYIYRDAYSDIMARHAANWYGVQKAQNHLRGIRNNDWAMYAGVEFGDSSPESSYQRTTNRLTLYASSTSATSTVEVWLGAIDEGEKIAEVLIEPTDSWTSVQPFSVPVSDITGRHDVYLRFTGNEGEPLMHLHRMRFHSDEQPTAAEDSIERPYEYSLSQNYPNPFNPATNITFTIPYTSEVTIEVFDISGRKVATLLNNRLKDAGRHSVIFDAGHLASGLYVYRMRSGNFVQTKKFTLIK